MWSDNFGLWLQSVRMLDALLCTQIKSCLPFSNSNPQFKPTDIIMSAIARNRMKNWEVIADNLSKAGWSWGYVSAIDSSWRTIWIADAHQGDEKLCLKKERERYPLSARAPMKGLPSTRRQPQFFYRNASDKRLHAMTECLGFTMPL
jgi:hypothetical protein